MQSHCFETIQHTMTSSNSCACNNEDEGLQAPQSIENKIELTAEKGTFRGRHGEALNADNLNTYTLRVIKKTLGKCQIQHRERVLVCWSGGLSSTTMLHMLDRAIPKEKRRKVFFEWDILFIDMNGDLQEACESELKRHNYSFENFYYEKFKLLNRPELQRNMKEASALEDFVRNAIQHQIIEFAQKNNYKKILLGSSANRLAIRILGDISKGRGTSIPLMISYKDDRFQAVDICRPMKEFLMKELGFYLYFHKLRTIHQNEPVTMKPVKTYSIDRLIETFIEGLQRDFPGTVHTILRTCDKLRAPSTFFSPDQFENALLEAAQSQKYVLCPECFTIVSKDEIEEALLKNSEIICYGCERNKQIIARSYNDLQDEENPQAEGIEDIYEEIHLQKKLLSRAEMREFLKDAILNYDDEDVNE